jgi:hypothetical protein
LHSPSALIGSPLIRRQKFQCVGDNLRASSFAFIWWLRHIGVQIFELLAISHGGIPGQLISYWFQCHFRNRQIKWMCPAAMRLHLKLLSIFTTAFLSFLAEISRQTS